MTGGSAAHVASNTTRRNVYDEVLVSPAARQLSHCTRQSHDRPAQRKTTGNNSGLRQARGKTRLGLYLGQRVEVTGTESPSLSTSSDALARLGSPASVTITVTSIKTIAKECIAHQGPAPSNT